MKRVGGKTYQLEEQNVEDAVNKFDCNEACTYSRKDEINLEKRYCFKSGKLESECLAAKGKNLRTNIIEQLYSEQK